METAAAVQGSDSSTAELTALVGHIEAAAALATRAVIGAYATQIRELARATDQELTFLDQRAGAIVDHSTNPENRGEGYWEVGLTEVAARHIGRYAREASYWLHCHALVAGRLTHGKGMPRWDEGDADLEAERARIERERLAMEEAQ